MKKKAFTLVEIVAVVALIAVLFMIFIPRILFTYEKGEVRLETVGTAIGGKPAPVEINETMFTFSDGTTQTVDVVGMLAGPDTRDENWNPVGSSYTVPQGAALTEVKIGRHVTTIGDDAFQDCTSLNSITIPNSVTTIGNWAFMGCTNLTIYYSGNATGGESN